MSDIAVLAQIQRLLPLAKGENVEAEAKGLRNHEHAYFTQRRGTVNLGL